MNDCVNNYSNGNSSCLVWKTCTNREKVQFLQCLLNIHTIRVFYYRIYSDTEKFFNASCCYAGK